MLVQKKEEELCSRHVNSACTVTKQHCGSHKEIKRRRKRKMKKMTGSRSGTFHCPSVCLYKSRPPASFTQLRINKLQPQETISSKNKQSTNGKPQNNLQLPIS
jgi:hypothetical protein